jgi:hypothetical protein
MIGSGSRRPCPRRCRWRRGEAGYLVNNAVAGPDPVDPPLVLTDAQAAEFSVHCPPFLDAGAASAAGAV